MSQLFLVMHKEKNKKNTYLFEGGDASSRDDGPDENSVESIKATKKNKYRSDHDIILPAEPRHRVVKRTMLRVIMDNCNALHQRLRR